MRPCLIIIALVAAAFVAQSTSEAQITGTSFQHVCLASNWLRDESVDFHSTVSPFMNTHGVLLGDWFCNSQHSGDFDGQHGVFTMTDSLQARDAGFETYSVSRGSVLFRTTADILVGIDGLLNYSLPGNSSEADFNFSAVRYDLSSGDSTTFWSDTNGTAQPGSGIFQISGSFVLPALHSDSLVYALSYGAELYSRAKSPTTGNLLTANGEVQFSFSVIPEPATLILLVPFATLRSTRPGAQHEQRGASPRSA